jgi:hypothetical protein
MSGFWLCLSAVLGNMTTHSSSDSKNTREEEHVSCVLEACVVVRLKCLHVCTVPEQLYKRMVYYVRGAIEHHGSKHASLISMYPLLRGVVLNGWDQTIIQLTTSVLAFVDQGRRALGDLFFPSPVKKDSGVREECSLSLSARFCLSGDAWKES